jgi:predicted DNA-binding protein YlxM (UPF0122 family)
MEKRIYEYGLLLDFYGQLLTQRQYEVLDLHFNGDYSLGEIAEHLDISRQGVYDNLRRGKSILNNYEKTLKLSSKHFKHKSMIEKILDTINTISINDMNDRDKEKMHEIKNCLEELTLDI